MTTEDRWRVQLWLGDHHLIEEHIAPAELAQAYADVIRLRIAGLPSYRVRCEPGEDPGSSSTSSPSQCWRNWHPTCGME